MAHRYIMYIQQNIPGNMSFELDRVTSIENARDKYREFCDAVGSDECSAQLYWYDSEAWESAEEFREIGCPFDYPSKIIERGPRGGVLVTNA